MSDWESIVRTHGPMAFDTAWRLLGNAADAEDVVQESLLDAFQLHSRQTVSNWGGLLRHLAVRRAIDRLRTRRTTQSLDFEPISADSDRAETAVRVRELADQLRWAIGRLPDREASVVSLHYLGEMRNTEIAESLGISVNAVGVALHKARAQLRDALSMGLIIRRSEPR